MAGSGGGGSGSFGPPSTGTVTLQGPSGGGAGGGSEPPCADLNFDTILAAPRPDVVASLAAGTQLRVRLDEAGLSLLVETADGRIAGAITPPIDVMDRMADCIDQGHRFTATVQAVAGGLVRLRVRAG
ncbi:MAG: hypothetical protein U0871_25245 [Gemmataceae bacterium]